VHAQRTAVTSPQTSGAAGVLCATTDQTFGTMNAANLKCACAAESGKSRGKIVLEEW
jgi:hypothetical protein